MNYAQLGNGFIAVGENPISVKQPKIKGGKMQDLKTVANQSGLEIASEYFSQAIASIQQAKKIVDAVNARLTDSLKVGEGK